LQMIGLWKAAIMDKTHEKISMLQAKMAGKRGVELVQEDVS